MATRQYIGARYVTKVYQSVNTPNTAEWDSGVTYEPLTMVSYLNNSYISRDMVAPTVGNPADNPDHWALTGFYNGQIAALDTRLSAAEDDITEIEEDVENLVNTSHMSGKRVLMIGDSYEGTSHWGTLVSQYLGHGSTTTYQSTVKKSSDNMVWISAQGGMGFTNNGGGKSSGNGFLTLVQNAAAAMTDDEKAGLNLICFVGGVNDAFYPVGDADYDLLGTNIAATNAYIKTTFPNADVLVFFIGRIRGTNPSSIVINDLKVAIQHYQGECGLNGWGFVTNAQYILYVDDIAIDDDNIHPRGIYGPHLASHIVSGMITGSCDVRGLPRETFTVTPASPFQSQTPCTLSREVVNNVTYCKINNFAFTTTSAVTLAYEDEVKLGTQNAFYANVPYIVKVAALIQEAGPVLGWHIMLTTVKFTGYDIYIANAGSSEDGITTLAAAAVILSPSLTIPIDTINI